MMRSWWLFQLFAGDFSQFTLVSLAGDFGFLSYFIMIGTVDSVATLSTGTLLRVLPTVPSAINALHTKAGSLT